MKTLSDYRRLPYTMLIQPATDGDETGYWIAEYVELRGCKTDGPTELDAVANLQELFDEFIEAHLESGTQIPEPIAPPVFSETPWLVGDSGQLRPAEPIPADAEISTAEGSLRPTETRLHYRMPA